MGVGMWPRGAKLMGYIPPPPPPGVRRGLGHYQGSVVRITAPYESFYRPVEYVHPEPGDGRLRHPSESSDAERGSWFRALWWAILAAPFGHAAWVYGWPRVVELLDLGEVW
jgi:hypothetical protein